MNEEQEPYLVKLRKELNQPKTIFDKTEELIDQAINLNLEVRKEFQKHLSENEYCSFDTRVVTMNLGRRAGHTTYILNHATDNDIVITRFMYEQHNTFKSKKSICIENLNFYYTPEPIDKVYVDNASLFERNQLLNFIYKIRANQYILLG